LHPGPRLTDATKVMPTTETARTTHTYVVRLVNESSVANEGSKNPIRSNDAAWGHQTRRGKKRSSLKDREIVTSSIQLRVLVFVAHIWLLMKLIPGQRSAMPQG
jgi:hypothetical protein